MSAENTDDVCLQREGGCPDDYDPQQSPLQHFFSSKVSSLYICTCIHRALCACVRARVVYGACGLCVCVCKGITCLCAHMVHVSGWSHVNITSNPLW